MNKKVIQVKHLRKSFEFFKKEKGLIGSLKSFVKREKLYAHAVDDISFEIEKGEFVGFLGPNGAGKTTTLKMLSGILNPSDGSIDILGFTPWERKKVFKKKFALVMGQKNQLWWDLPPIESYLLFKEMYEIPDERFKENLDYLTKLLNVEPFLEVQVRKLSLGQRMKCELIGALLHDPEILFLDEPTIGLDVVSQTNIRAFLKEYNEKKKATIILTSHYMEDIKRLCNRMIMIDKGKVVYDGSYAQFTEDYARERIIELTFSEKVAKEKLTKYGEVASYKEQSATLALPKEKITHTISEILKDLPVENVSIHDKELEEIIREQF